MRNLILTNFLAPAALLGIFMLLPIISLAAVSNSIYVSSESDSQSTASVRTVINGEVVEDYTAHEENGSIEVENRVVGDDVETRINERREDAEEQRQEMLELIERLKELIDLYTSMLSR